MNKQITINAKWDEAEKIWYATSNDVVGLHVCCATLDEVIEVVDDVLPDLLKHNLDDDFPPFIPYHLMHEHLVKAHS